MAYPFIFESNFEQGTNAEWDTETDTGSKLDFPHFSALSRVAGSGIPFRGAYCMRVDLRAGDTNNHTVTEGDIDIADGATRYFRFYVHVSKDFTATADDTFNIFELQQAGGTVEVSLGMRVTASSNLLEIGVGDGTAPTSFVTCDRGRHVCVELLATVSSIGAGVVTLFLDGGQVATLTSQTHAAAVGQGVLGVQDQLSTTTGVLLFDQFVMDDARVYPIQNRFPTQIDVTKDQHLFVGPGCIDGASITSTSADNTIRFYDTDTANTTVAQSRSIALANAGSSGVSGPVYFEKGCYIVLAGTSPTAQVFFVRSSDKRGQHGPQYYSDGAIRQYGLVRKG